MADPTDPMLLAQMETQQTGSSTDPRLAAVDAGGCAPPVYVKEDDVSQNDGKIVPVYECHCVECESAALGLGHTRTIARQELRRYGWRRRRGDGRWRCGDCHEKLTGASNA